MTCEVIRDLLPLCADGVASEESYAAVKAHIRTCDECRALYKKMCSPMEAQEAPQEPDYMDAVRRQKKENRRFVRKTYGVVFLIVAIFFLGRALHYNGWIYSSETVDRATVERKLPQALLTENEKALAKEIFSLPQVQQAVAETGPSETCDFTEEQQKELEKQKKEARGLERKC